MLPQPDVVAFPKPPKAPDGSLLYDRVPNKPEAEKIPLNNMSPSLKRRTYEDMNGIDSKYLSVQLTCLLEWVNKPVFLTGFYSDLDWDDGKRTTNLTRVNSQK